MSPRPEGPETLSNVRVQMAFETRGRGGAPFLDHLSGQQRFLLKGRVIQHLLLNEGFGNAQVDFDDPTNARHPAPLQFTLDRWGDIAPIDPRSGVPATAQICNWATERINIGRRAAGLREVFPLTDWGTACTFIPKPPVHEDIVTQYFALDGGEYRVRILGGTFDRITVPTVEVRPFLLINFTTDGYNAWPEYARMTGAAGDGAGRNPR